MEAEMGRKIMARELRLMNWPNVSLRRRNGPSAARELNYLKKIWGAFK